MAQLAIAGLSYASVAASQVRLRDGYVKERLPIYWPWDQEWWKPSDDPIRNLAKAGALIAAEIDRLQRKAEADQVVLEARNKRVALEELLKQPTSDPEKLVRCTWCGAEMVKPAPGITTAVCDDCMPF
jgi:hypothetical protein